MPLHSLFLPRYAIVSYSLPSYALVQLFPVQICLSTVSVEQLVENTLASQKEVCLLATHSAMKCTYLRWD